MHHHAPAGGGIRKASNRRLLAISLAITATVMVVQIAGGVLSGSLALLADAAHMFTDTAALVIALVANAVASRPADDRRTYGYQRAEVFGALINAAVLIALSVWIAVESVGRLMAPGDAEVEGGVMLVIAIVGLVANAVALWLLSSAQRNSINVRGAYLEVMGDLLGSAAVIIAALVIVLSGWVQADAIASLLIAAMIVPRAIGLLREVFSVLSESAPQGTQIAEIRDHILGAPGVAEVHDVHVWQLTRGAPVFTAHVVVEPAVLEAGGAAELLASLQSCLADHFDVAHSTFQIERGTRRPRSGRARVTTMSVVASTGSAAVGWLSDRTLPELVEGDSQVSALTHHVGGVLVGTQAPPARMTQRPIPGPLGELHLGDEFRPDPQGVRGIRRRDSDERICIRSQRRQRLREPREGRIAETGADTPCVLQPIRTRNTEQQ
jgi:cobalt-zinc-cadmium efflux system protein